MAIFKKWMFIVNPTDNSINSKTSEQKIIEEIGINRIDGFDKIIIFFLFFLMCICLISLITGIILLILHHSEYRELFLIFTISLSYLIGYFFGTNKKNT